MLNHYVRMEPIEKMKKEALQQYRTHAWRKFRSEVIRLHGSACSVCGKTEADGIKLHVHHKRYISGLKMWDYDYGDCEALCAGCHAQEHGKIQPQRGWTLDGYDDLEDLVGTCENCGQSIRYVFFVTHPDWRSLEVGELCCDRLTCSTAASELAHGWKLKLNRLKSFASPRNWESLSGGRKKRSFKGVHIVIFPDTDQFGLLIDGRKGKQRFKDELAAKGHIFELIENGKLKSYLAKKAKERREYFTF